MNRLKDETSPYLAQHAHNPVDWYPWGPEALATAREQDKPILLSIGYSACHWCHVMAHESFEDDETAALMNENFVNIKVDREERPDLDRIYQTAHQLLTRNRGGWPLTMFLAPDDHIPFFGGTYFPRESRHGLPGFRDVLARIAQAYAARDQQIDRFKAEMAEALAQALSGTAPGDELADPSLPERACAEMAQSFDAEFGGFGEAPRFPHAAGLELLLNESLRRPRDADAERNRHMFERTLTGMARGGINDHLGGGFCRYSVDATWTIPHFEKMLYDNGPLLRLYAMSAALTGGQFHADVAAGIADWALREMRSPEGAFYSSVDADSEGEEGRFYVWSRDEVRELAGPDYELFAACYGLDRPSNFEGRWHLRLPADGLPPAALEPGAGERLASVARRLFERRSLRVAPGLDDKILCSWNALMIGGLAAAGRLLGRADYVDAAASAADYQRDVHWNGERLLATSKGGVAHLNAYLDDYAFLIGALLELLAARWRGEDLALATALADVMLERFEDAERGGFFFTSSDHEKLLQRSRTFSDESLPSGNAVAARALLGLGHLVGETRYLDAAGRTLQAAADATSRWPSAHAAMLLAHADHLAPPLQIVLRAGSWALPRAWAATVAGATVGRAAAYVIPAGAKPLPGVLAARVPIADAPVTAYVCSGRACSAPVTAPDALGAALDD